MRTAKEITKLCEEYFKSRRLGRDEELVIYDNPTSSDYKEIMKAAKRRSDFYTPELRFVVDGRSGVKKVYVWDAYFGCHEEGKALIGISKTLSDDPHLIDGTAKMTSGGGIEVLELTTGWLHWIKSFEKELKSFDELDSSHWSWVNSYIPKFTDSIAKSWRTTNSLLRY